MQHSRCLRISLKIQQMLYVRLLSAPFNELSEWETERLIVGVDVRQVKYL